MQKLKGISSGQNNKSCGIIHHEAKKIGFTFFRFSCDFIRNLQEIDKALILFQIRLCSKDPGKKGNLTQMPQVCTQALRKSWPFAISSPGAAGGGPIGNSGESRGRSGRGRQGNGLRVASGRFGGSVGARSSREGGHAGGPGRWPPRLAVPARGGEVGNAWQGRLPRGPREV
jgi:hypothetical protein